MYTVRVRLYKKSNFHRNNPFLYKLSEKKSLATPDCFAPYLVNVATKEYCFICLETVFIAEEFYVKMLVVDSANEE